MIKTKRTFKLIFALALLVALVGVFLIYNPSKMIVRADGENNNKVYLKDSTVDASDSALVIVELVAEGKAKDKIRVSYHTLGGTAMPGLDFASISNTIDFELDGDGKYSYKISIKCLNNNETRSKYKIVNSNDTSKVYGRYFTLQLDEATNATIDPERSSCKCFTQYNHSVSANIGVYDEGGNDFSYFEDFNVMEYRFTDGSSDIEYGHPWKTWDAGVTFINDRTQSWVSNFINEGIADAYASFVVKKVDDDDHQSKDRIHWYFGNRELYEKYPAQNDGMILYLNTEPCSDKGGFLGMGGEDRGYQLNLTTMNRIYENQDKNPYKMDDDDIDLKQRIFYTDAKKVYWYNQGDGWYADVGAFVNTTFYQVKPYNGVLDAGIIINHDDDDQDRIFKRCWQFMTLVDYKAPEIVSEYVDDSQLKETGKLRFYVRFNEPVKSSKLSTVKGSYLQVNFNGGNQNYYAKYVDGNYTDTLVYELDSTQDKLPKANLTEVKYQLPNDDICDLACNYNEYRSINNNKISEEITGVDRNMGFLNGAVNLVTPAVAVDVESSLSAKNIYNIMLSINGNGERELTAGTVYYEWSKEENKENSNDPANYKNSHVFVPEENGSIGLTLVKNESEGIDSGTYYLHALAISDYGISVSDTFGPYVLDGDPPSVSQEQPSPNELKNKKYSLVIYNKAGNKAGISTVTLVVKYKDSDEVNQERKLVLYKNSEIVYELKGVVTKAETDESTTFTYTSNINEANDFIKKLMVDGEGPAAVDINRRTFDVYFSIEDTAGNTINSNIIKATYDTRELFKTTLSITTVGETVTDGYTLIDDIAVSYKAYDLSTVTNNKNIVIEIAEADRPLLVDGTAFTASVNDKTYNADEGTNYRITISDLTAGYYDIIPKISGTSTLDGTKIDKVAETISFYITNNKNDDTTNKLISQGNVVLTNKVFQIPETRFYYLDQGGSTVNNHLYGASVNGDTGKYEGGSSNPTFSNINEAKKYVKYMELQDMYLVKITPAIASLLNSGTASTSYVKAPGETMNAQEGQLWIRYKKATWTVGSSAFSWGFYYYSSGGNVEDGINANNLSNNLNKAISSVVDTITNAGSIIYLVTEETISQTTGAPYLPSTAIHVNEEVATYNKLNQNFISPVSYAGDKNIYKNNITIDNKSYCLATNMVVKVATSTRIFYKYAGVEENWTELQLEDGKALSKLLVDQATGYYLFREYDTKGISEFYVYYDKTLPKLDVVVGDTPTTLDGTILSFSNTTFTINEIKEEIDPLSYVAIYTYPNKNLYKVLYNDDLKATGGYKLEGNNYYIQVGDRSGNMATYSVLLSNSALDVAVTIPESQSSLIIQVLNRIESEIYSYEVYLNERLITTEFQEKAIYKDPGVYRIAVTDIYGNSVNKIAEFQYKSPEIEWYYMNSSETYSKYDSENIVRMVIYEDETNSRITNVYASTLLKMKFITSYGDDKIEFEVLDLNSGDYSYNDSNETITMNRLAGFRLRVWYQSLPENDHIYNVRIDTMSPTITSKFLGTTHSKYFEAEGEGEDIKIVSTSDYGLVDLTNYNEGDYVNLDNLKYTPGSTQQIDFYSGNVISGTRIILTLNDPSGIKNYTISRNDQNITVDMTKDNELILNGYGKYLITVTDLLGNVGTMSFINTDEPLTSAYVDNNQIADSVEAYGHTDVRLNILYAGEARVLVKGKNETYTYVINYDGKFVTYGRYVCVVEKTQDGETGQITETKKAVYQGNDKFSFDTTSDANRSGTWYPVITEDNHHITIAIIDGKPALKVELVNEDIDVELSYGVGNNVFPSYYVVKLSNEEPTIKLLTDGKEVEIPEDAKYIYIAGTLTIDSDVNQDITKIEYGYSQKPTIEKLEIVYENGAFTQDVNGLEDGFYRIVVTNKYNNQKEYLLAKTDSFESVVTVTYQDKTTKEFVGNEDIIYSNASIKIDVYSEAVTFEVNGEATSGIYESGITTLELYKQGEYDLRVVSSNGISESFDLVISTDSGFIYNEAWLSGYNEKALLKDQGYTNTKLSINKPEDVLYIAYKFGEETVILYDVIAEEKINDLGKLNEAIGNDGDGVYEVLFRNKYGDLATKTINYSTTVALELSRKIVDDQNVFSPYDLTKAIEENFYSNYILRFATTSPKYIFTIDGAQVSLEEAKTIQFDNASGNGSFGYDITYLDEYGNYIEFKAELYRTDIEIDTSLMKEIELNNKLYTKDDIIIKFADHLTATLSVDGGTKNEYVSGTKHYKDGTYEFIVEDIAGNRNKYTIIHKSINHYTLTDSLNGKAVIIGGVINNASAIFTSNDDSRIVGVYKNGRKLDGYTSTSFTTTGHWEILIRDSIGNEDYAGFYIVNNALSKFEYSAPFDYSITEVWYTNLEGERRLLDMQGQSISLTENGDYAIVVTGKETTSTFNFSITIDDSKPTASLVGVNDGGITSQDVKFSGLKSGDTVVIYKDGELISTTEVGLSNTPPEINSGGTYKVIITSVSGAQIEYNFTRKKVANVATSVFIIIAGALAIAGLTIGLLYHTRFKTDSEK